MVSQEEAAARLLRWLEAELRRTDRSRVLLLFLPRETLLLLLSWLSVEESYREEVGGDRKRARSEQQEVWARVGQGLEQELESLVGCSPKRTNSNSISV